MSMMKYIIIGMPRTGSTLVQTTLAQHPKVRSFGELFHWVRGEREGRHAIETPAGKLFFDPEKDDPQAFLDEVVWAGDRPDVRAAGFKLFAKYVQAESTQDLFSKLKANNPDLSVIYIERRNILDVMASWRMASVSGEWMRRTGEGEEKQPPTCSFPVDAAEEFLDTHVGGVERLDRWVNGMRCLRVDYDDISDNFQRVARDMFEFLGVEPIDIQPAIVKQANRSPRQVLENWDELAAHFRGTAHEHLFGRDAKAATGFNRASAGGERPAHDERLAQDPNVFRTAFAELSDDEWRRLLQRSVRESELGGVCFPRLPDSDTQRRIHGAVNEDAIEEAFRFFLFVKERIGERFLRPSAKFLDFGAGWGRTLLPFMRYFDLANIYAYEPNRLFLTLARSLNPHVCFLGGEYMPNGGRIPRRMFDLIVGYSVFAHLSRNSAAAWLREIAEALNPGGVAAFTTQGERFIDQLAAEKAQLKAGDDVSETSRRILQGLSDPDSLREPYRAGKFIWMRSRNDAAYGDVLMGRAALQQILSEQALPLKIVAFDTVSLPQDAFLLRRL